jgi:collagen type VI alpha
VFVLDSSASIWEPDFYRQLSFVENIVKQFKIGPNNTQVGVVTFGEYTTHRFHLNKYHDATKLQKAISTIRFNPGRATNTGNAIKFMSNVMFKENRGARKNVPKVAVVITDGRSTDTIKTAKAARDARELGIHLFSIGVGNKFDRKELENIGNKPSKDFVFTVDNYSALNNILNVFAVKTCQGIYISYFKKLTFFQCCKPFTAISSKPFTDSFIKVIAVLFTFSDHNTTTNNNNYHNSRHNYHNSCHNYHNNSHYSNHGARDYSHTTHNFHHPVYLVLVQKWRAK